MRNQTSFSIPIIAGMARLVRLVLHVGWLVSMGLLVAQWFSMR
jgi:hypothetical protein